MTAIYSFASPGAKVAFIAADNLDLGNNQKVDKITFLAGRYAIATCGAGVVTTALDALSSFEGFENVSSPKELQDILYQCWEIVRKECEIRYRIARASMVGKHREWADFISKYTTLIILDCTEYKLYEMTVKKLFPPPQEPPFTELIQKQEHTLHLAELARLVARRDNEPLEISDKTDVAIWDSIKARIERDKIKEEKIGDIGAGLIVIDGKITRYTAFCSAFEYMIDNIYRHKEAELL